jgi:hypothetical protein
MEKEVSDLVALVGSQVRAVEGLPEEMISGMRARKLEAVVKEVEMVVEQLLLLKERGSENEVELEKRLADVEKTRGELGSVQLGFKEKADAKARLFAIACAQREEAAAQRVSTAGQRVIELQIELAAERKRRVEAEEEAECARAEAGIWQGRFREESARRLGQLVSSWRKVNGVRKEFLEAKRMALEMTEAARNWRLKTEGLLRKASSREALEEQEALEASIGLEEERQLLSAAARLRETAFEKKVSSFQRKAVAILQTQMVQLHLGGWSGYLLFKLLERMNDLLSGKMVGLVPLVCSDAKLQVALAGLEAASSEFRVARDAVGDVEKSVKDLESLREGMERLWSAVDMDGQIAMAHAAQGDTSSSGGEEVGDEDAEQGASPGSDESMGGETAGELSGPLKAAGEGLSDEEAVEESSAPQFASETESEGWAGVSATEDEKTAVEESSAPRPEQEGAEKTEGDEVSDEEMSEAIQLNGLQKVLASVMWPSSWDEERRRQLYGDLMRRNEAAALSEAEWRASFEKAVGGGIGVCLVPMLVEVMRTGYRMAPRSQKNSRRSCATHGKVAKKAGPCVWVAQEVGVVSPRFVIKERT